MASSGGGVETSMGSVISQLRQRQQFDSNDASDRQRSGTGGRTSNGVGMQGPVKTTDPAVQPAKSCPVTSQRPPQPGSCRLKPTVAPKPSASSPSLTSVEFANEPRPSPRQNKKLSPPTSVKSLQTPRSNFTQTTPTQATSRSAQDLLTVGKPDLRQWQSLTSGSATDQDDIVVGDRGLLYRRLPLPDEQATRPPRKPARPSVIVDLTSYRAVVASSYVVVLPDDDDDDDDAIYDDARPVGHVDDGRGTWQTNTAVARRISSDSSDEDYENITETGCDDDELYQNRTELDDL